MTTFTYTVQTVAEKQNTYKITWYKGEEESKQELCSGEVTITGTEEGVTAALTFAADDIRKAHPDLFVEDIVEPFMEVIEEDNQNV